MGGRRGGGGAYLDLVGAHSAAMYLLFGAVYWSLGRRGYFGVSNVALVMNCCCVEESHGMNESISYVNRRVSQMRALLAACRKLAGVWGLGVWVF